MRCRPNEVVVEVNRHASGARGDIQARAARGRPGYGARVLTVRLWEEPCHGDLSQPSRGKQAPVCTCTSTSTSTSTCTSTCTVLCCAVYDARMCQHMHRSISMDSHAASIAGTEYCVCCNRIRVCASQVREAIHVKFVPGALNPTGKPDYEGNTYKYWHAGQNNTGWNYVSAAALRAATGRRSSATHVACLVLNPLGNPSCSWMPAWHRSRIDRRIRAGCICSTCTLN